MFAMKGGTCRNGLRAWVTMPALSAWILTLGALTLTGFSPVIWVIDLGVALLLRRSEATQ